MKILVIKLRYLGDVLLATPVVRVLREAYPAAEITALVNRGTEEILRHNPDLDDLLVLERGGLVAQWHFLVTLRRRGFDAVIDLTDADRSATIARFTSAAVRIGFNEEHRWRGLLYTAVVRPRPGLHRLERNLEALRPLGLDPKPRPLTLRTSEADEAAAARLLEEVGLDRPLIMLQPGARYWFKAWPPERFADLADRLADRVGCRVLIGGHAGERVLAEQIRAQARCGPIVLAGRTTVLQYAAVLRRCALYIGNDNGPMHMAAALGVPVVALFGPSDPAEWGPRGTRCAVLYKGLDCRGCFHPSCDRGEQSCMRRIQLNEVEEAAVGLLAAGGRRQPDQARGVLWSR